MSSATRVSCRSERRIVALSGLRGAGDPGGDRDRRGLESFPVALATLERRESCARVSRGSTPWRAGPTS